MWGRPAVGIGEGSKGPGTEKEWGTSRGEPGTRVFLEGPLKDLHPDRRTCHPHHRNAPASAAHNGSPHPPQELSLDSSPTPCAVRFPVKPNTFSSRGWHTLSLVLHFVLVGGTEHIAGVDLPHLLNVCPLIWLAAKLCPPPFSLDWLKLPLWDLPLPP